MIRATELHGLTWHKSSLSNSGGSNCVEVASTLPTTWRKASYSASGGSNCVEVAALTTSHTIAIRDSKNPDGPALLLTNTAWHGLINASHGNAVEI